MTPDYAQKNNLASVADLQAARAALKLGAPPEFATRFEGLRASSASTGSTTEVQAAHDRAPVQGARHGKVNTADVFTTDGQLQGGKYVVLTDPKNVFGFQNVAPVVSQKVLTAEGPAFAETLNAVSAKLTTRRCSR